MHILDWEIDHKCDAAGIINAFSQYAHTFYGPYEYKIQKIVWWTSITVFAK